MRSEARHLRFRRRLLLSAAIGLLAGLVWCVRLEATSPVSRNALAWRRPPSPDLASQLARRTTTKPTEAEPPKSVLGAVSNKLDINRAEPLGDRLVQHLPDGNTVVYTVFPRAQERIRKLLDTYEVPFAAVVALDPRTGNIRAFVEVTHDNPSLDGLARKAIAPAASVFKLVTTAALIERAGVSPNHSVCFHGGLHGITAGNLVDDAARDTRCETVGEALARSSNVVFAKLADRGLDTTTLLRAAESFGFERAIPFVWPVEVSPARIPTERLERARTAAGFWHTRLSPLHAALIASAIANGGDMMRPRLVDAVLDPTGGPLGTVPPARPWLRAVRPQTAKVMTEMMEGTVAFGTAHKAFAEKRRPANLVGLPIAGKTGSLSTRGDIHYGFSWFVGFAPADAPEIALAVLVVNPPKWRIKAPAVARDALSWLLEENAQATTAPPEQP